MAKRENERIVETAIEARGAERGPHHAERAGREHWTGYGRLRCHLCPLFCSGVG
jgi:hypothetical protein